MSGPQPAPSGGKKPLPPWVVPVAGLAAVVAVIVAVNAFGPSGTTMSDGSDVRTPDPNLKDLSAGVKYRDLKPGVGEECPPGAKVKIHYTGWLLDGTVFDSSRDRGKAAEFELDNLIPGWREGIPGMKVGGVRKLVISPEKGYGGRSTGKIPANSTLVFEVEMLAFGAGGPPEMSEPERPEPPGPEKLSDGTAPGADDAGLKDIGGGLKIRDLKEGTGAECKPGATVIAHYTGWLTNGRRFDSSVGRGAPMDFSLNGVVKGWQQGIPGMKVGGKRKLVIPPELGYAGQRQGSIPPNSTLVFEVELVGLK